jgi:hypothetical protein
MPEATRGVGGGLLKKKYTPLVIEVAKDQASCLTPLELGDGST